MIEPDQYNADAIELKLRRNGAVLRALPSATVHYEFAPGQFADLALGADGLSVRIADAQVIIRYQGLVQAAVRALQQIG